MRGRRRAARDGRRGADCSDGIFCNGEEQCDPSSADADMLGCVDGIPACTGACDEASRRCALDCTTPDQDGDGYDAIDCGGDDCDDFDPNRHPSAAEICDPLGVDEDCDPSTIGARDADGDGVVSAACCNGDTCGADCDDARAGANPTAPEVCDGQDNECDGALDEGVVQTFLVDTDGDGFGDPDGVTREGCSPSAGFVADATDCDDGERSTSPAASEICGDGADNDCDEAVDEFGDRLVYRDDDGDGFGDGSMSMMVLDCSTPDGFVTIPGDCNDDDADVNPGAPDVCDRRDTNCSLGGSAAGSGSSAWVIAARPRRSNVCSYTGTTGADSSPPRMFYSTVVSARSEARPARSRRGRCTTPSVGEARPPMATTTCSARRSATSSCRARCS